MKKISKKRIGNIKAGGAVVMLSVGFIVGIMLITPMMTSTVHVERMPSVPYTWKAVGDADPGAGKGGFLYFGTYPHSADPGTDYASNLSSATFYEYTEATSGEMNGETPHTTAFDFVVKFRVNVSQGYNVSGTTWESSWVRANLTVDFDFASDISDAAMTIVQIATNSEFAWYHGYINNAASGYQITHDEKFTVSNVKVQYYG
jgi:hypothetical protein